MTHTEIDAMPAGPELDELACRALGWTPKCRGCLCDGQECRTPEYCDELVYPRISSESALALKAMESVYYIRITKAIDGQWLSEVATEQTGGLHLGHGSETAPLAIARAIAKMAK